MKTAAIVTFVALLLPAAALWAGEDDAARGEILTNEDVVKLVSAKVDEEIVVLKIQSATCRFDMSTKELVKLKEAGVSKEVMLEMWKQFKSIDRSKKQVVSLVVQGFMSGEEDYQRSLKQLKLMGAEAVPELIRHLIHSEEPKIRAGCAESLKLIGDQKALEPLLTMLVDPVASVRSEVAKAVAELKNENTAAELLKELGNRSVKVDGYVLALGHMKQPSAVEAITKVLQSTASPEDRAAAAFALGLIGDKSSVQPLMDAVADNKIAMVRESACRALVRMGTPDALPAVIKAIDRYPETRAELALQLRHWRDKRSIEALIELLRDPDKGVQDSAWDSLKVLTGEAFGRDYEAWSSWWEVAKVEGMRF